MCNNTRATFKTQYFYITVCCNNSVTTVVFFFSSFTQNFAPTQFSRNRRKRRNETTHDVGVRRAQCREYNASSFHAVRFRLHAHFLPHFALSFPSSSSSSLFVQTEENFQKWDVILYYNKIFGSWVMHARLMFPHTHTHSHSTQYAHVCIRFRPLHKFQVVLFTIKTRSHPSLTRNTRHSRKEKVLGKTSLLLRTRDRTKYILYGYVCFIWLLAKFCVSFV